MNSFCEIIVRIYRRLAPAHIYLNVKMEYEESRQKMPRLEVPPALENTNSPRSITRRNFPFLARRVLVTCRYFADNTTARLHDRYCGGWWPSWYGKIIPTLFPAKSSCETRLRRKLRALVTLTKGRGEKTAGKVASRAWNRKFDSHDGVAPCRRTVSYVRRLKF